MADRIFINKKYKPYIDEWSSEKNILDFKTIENIEKFTIAAALGVNSPLPAMGAREGYVRLQSIPSDNKAILSSILLGNVDNKRIDESSNEEACYKAAEECVESGLLKLKEKIDDCGGDEELLCKRLMVEIDRLYEINVKPSIEGCE